MFKWNKPTVQMLGRWQPWHKGHTELFKKALEKTGQVCIMVRSMPKSKNNPFNFYEVTTRIRDTLHDQGFMYGKEFIVMEVPNIVDISYGRDVGYSITEHDLPETIKKISGTGIRKMMME